MEKPEFDPNQPFQSADVSNNEKPEFDPNKPFASVEENNTPMPDATGMGNSPVGQMLSSKLSDKQKEDIGTGFQQGAKSGATFLPDLISKLAGQGNISNKLSAKLERVLAEHIGDDSTKDYYNNLSDKQLEDTYQKQTENAAKAAPIPFALSSMVTSAPSIIVSGAPVSAATKGISAAAELGPIATRVVQAAGNVASGAGLGEAQGIANSNAPTLAGRAKEALPSAALGAGLGLGAEGLAAAPEIAEAVSSKVQPVVQKLSNNFAVNALKPNTADIAKFNAQPGLKNSVGQYLNDNELIGPFSNQQTMASNIAGAKQAAGQRVGNATQTIDDAVTNSTMKPGANVPEIETSAVENIKPNQANDIESSGLDIQSETPNVSSSQPEATGISSDLNQTQQAVSQKIGSQPANVQQQVQQILNPQRIANELETEVLTPMGKAGDAANVVPVVQEQILKFGDIKDTSLANLFKYRQELDSSINFNKNPLTGADTPASQALKTYRSAIDTKLMDAAKQVDSLTDAGAYDALVAAKKEYNITSTANKIAQRSAAQQESTSSKLVLPTLAGAIGKGAAVTLGTGGSGAIPAAAAAIGAVVTKKFGNQFAATSLNQLSSLLKTSPQTLGEFAAPLQDAANRGASALAATNFALYQNDPKYRAVVDPLQKAGEDQAKTQGGQ